ncbi:MFS transporter [Streptomyces sp. NPDC060184]|uniref:MFS transporter n=1 Tax=Streptomyces sp. NPDC060184 TaxID=3347064 RepID=UPI003654131F
MGAARRRAALLLAAVVSVNASYTVMIPFVPDLEHRVDAGPLVVALTFALFAAAKALAQPVGGWWVDRWRADRVAMLSMLLAAVGIAATALATDGVTLLTARVVWGVGEGLVSPALYAGMTALCRRYDVPTGRMMGSFGAAAIAGFLLGPLVAGVAGPAGLTGLFLAGAAVTAVTAVGLVLAIPGPDAGKTADTGAADATGDPGALGAAAATDAPAPTEPAAAAGAPASPSRWYVWALLLGLMDMFTFIVYSALEPLLPMHLRAVDDAASSRSAISAVLVGGLAVSAFVMWLMGRFSPSLRRLTVTGLVLSAVGLCALAAGTSVQVVAACFLVYMAGYATLFLAARRGVVELKAANADDGKAYGLFGFVSDLGNVVGPLIGVALYETTGRFTFVLLGAASGVALLAVAVVLRRPGLLPGRVAAQGGPSRTPATVAGTAP